MGRIEMRTRMLTHTWQSGGMTVTVTTSRSEAASEDAFIALHKARVNAAMAEWPK